MMPRRKQSKPLQVQSDEEGEQDHGTKPKAKTSPHKTRGSAASLVDGQKEHIDRTKRGGKSKELVEHQKEEEQELEEEEEEDEDNDDDDDGGEEKELLIAEDEEDGDSDISDDRDSDNSEDLEHQAPHNGTMTRRQASQLKEGASGDAGAKKKNRTCDYCGVLKATPAALVRHLRKHTGERPFVCTLCGKAYKAKRSLHLHENTVHKGLAKNPLPTQVPLDNAAGASLTMGDTLRQVSGMPPISESTKSLLRETLVSSRKAKDSGSTPSTATTPITTTTSTTSTTSPGSCDSASDEVPPASTNTTTTSSSDDTSSTANPPPSERLGAPNLVNLLTSDLRGKVEQILAASSTTTTSVSSSSSSSLPSTSPHNVSSPALSIPNYKVDSPNVLNNSLDLSKNEEGQGKREGVTEKTEQERQEEEEQAEDLSVHHKRESKVKAGDEVLAEAGYSGDVIACEFCPKTFKNEMKKANHIQTAHGIIVNLGHQGHADPKTAMAPAVQRAAIPSTTLVSQYDGNDLMTATKNPTAVLHHQPQPRTGHVSAHGTTTSTTASPGKKSSSHHHLHSQKHSSSFPSHINPNSSTLSNIETFTKIDMKSSKRVLPPPLPPQQSVNAASSAMDGKIWAGMMAAAGAASSTDPAVAAYSALLSKQMRDSGGHISSMLSPSSATSSSSASSLSPLSSSTPLMDAAGVKLENSAATPNGSGVIPVPGVSMADGVVTGVPTEESNALPYYITSRMLQDFNLDEVTIQDSEKTVLAEDGGHRRCRMTVMKETVLATRLDGINNITGRLSTIYKCHLCKRVFSSLVRYNNHMPSHADIEITTYDCRYCEASFRSHIQIVKHLQCHREKFAGFNTISLEDAGPPASKKKADLIPGMEGGSPVPLSLTSPSFLNNSTSSGPIGLSRLPSYSEENSNEMMTALSSPVPANHEPGERKNGGYSCPKCRKNFTREYLLQRHMRIHRNQNSFYCPDCESGFSGELDLMEHKKQCHGLKSVEDQQKYNALLNQAHANHVLNQLKQMTKGSERNDSGSPATPVSGLAAATNASLITPSGLPTSLHGGVAGNNGVGASSGPFSMVDLKGIDLRRGEEVKVRMMEGGVETGKEKEEEWAKKIWNEQYKRAWMTKAMEMQAQALFGGMFPGGNQENMELMKQNLARMNQWRMAAMAGGGQRIDEEAARLKEEEEVKRRMDRVRAVRRQAEKEEEENENNEEEESRHAMLKEEEGRKRKLMEMEQERLKAKLASQGMGDVTVVLPDAPSPDENGVGDGRKDDSTTAASSHMACVNLSTKTTFDDGVRKEKKVDTESNLYGNSDSKGAKIDAMNFKASEIGCSDVSGTKRPSVSSEKDGSCGMPPAKSRRKAFKPQRINHFEEEKVLAAADKKETVSLYSKSGSGVGGTKQGDTQKEYVSLGDKADKLDNNMLLQLSKWKQLVALGGAQVFSASPEGAMTSSHPPQAVGATGPAINGLTTPFNALMTRTLASNYSNKMMAAFRASGGDDSKAMAAADGGDDSHTMNEDSSDGMAIDLSTATTDKDRSGKANAAKSHDPLCSSTPKPLSKTSASSAIPRSSSSPIAPSSSSSSPAIPYDDPEAMAAAGKMALDHHLPKTSSSQKAGSFSRSMSLDSEAIDQDYLHNKLPTNNNNNPSTNNNNQLNLQIPLNPAQFHQALLASGSAGLNPDSTGLVGFPQVLWSAAGHHLNAGGKPKSTMSSGISSGGKVVNGSGSLAALCVNTNSNGSSKSRTSSPSPVPSPNGLETSSSSGDGRKVTSLSRTHSRLSVVNEPLDRNALCKPKVMEDGRSVYSCAICHKNFLSLSDINRHMDFHEDIRPYKCKYCDYYARTNSQLKVHKLRHEGVREFCCRVCNYKGVTQSDLNRHTKSQVHLLRSNHVCHHCGEGFVTPKALRDHSAMSCNGSHDGSYDGSSFEKELGGGRLMIEEDEEGMEDEDDEEDEERYNSIMREEIEERERMAGMDMRLMV